MKTTINSKSADCGLRSSVFLLLLITTLAHHAAAISVAEADAQLATLRNQRVLAVRELDNDQQRLDAAQRALAGLQDKRTRKLEEWTTWNAGKCAFRGHLSLDAARVMQCGNRPNQVYYEMRPTGPEIVTANTQRPLAQKRVTEAEQYLAETRTKLARLEASISNVESLRTQAQASAVAVAIPEVETQTVVVPVPVITQDVVVASVENFPTSTVEVTEAPAPVTPTVVEDEPPNFFARHKGKIITGVVVLAILAWLARKPTA
jgi:hypothetical protein